MIHGNQDSGPAAPPRHSKGGVSSHPTLPPELEDLQREGRDTNNTARPLGRLNSVQGRRVC